MPIIHDAVDRYLDALSAEDHPVLEAMATHARERSFPYIGPQVGRLLALLTRLTDAREVLELGSGFGYSAFWFARALTDGGRVHLTDRSDENLDRARAWFDEAELSERAVFHAGDALETLARLEGPFDIVLADIDKQDYPKLPALLRDKLRPGGLLLVDNVLWRGEVAEDEPPSAAGKAARRLNELLAAHPDYELVVLPVRDGLAVARRR